MGGVTLGLFSFIGGLIGGNKGKKGVDAAAKLQYDAQMAGIAETGRQFDTTNANFAPYRELGAAGVQGYSNLSGLSGDDAQATALAGLRESPFYQSLYRAGEEAILANGSATGGIRGGNMQRSLADFGEDTFASAIERELSMFSGAIGVGGSAVSQTGQFGAQAVAEQNAGRNAGADALAQAKLTRAGITQQQWNNGGAFLDSAVSAIAGGMGGGGGAAGGGFNWGKLF